MADDALTPEILIPAQEGATAVAVREAPVAVSPGDRLVGDEGPALPVRRALRGMLDASVASWGDVVQALLIDLEGASEDIAALSWLASSRQMWEREAVVTRAAQQLQWWDAWLRQLPYPRIRADQLEAQRPKLRAARSRARLLARDQALTAHRQHVDHELQRTDLSPAVRGELRRVREEPEAHEWRVDPQAWIDAALAATPQVPDHLPIGAEDLDPTQPYTCFHAVQAMRDHPELGPRARHMDAALAALLQAELGVDRATAGAHAAVLTDIFWVALRRCLESGSHQLATTIRLVAGAQPAPLQTRFADELLRSWLAHLERIPLPKPRTRLLDRVPFLGRLLGRSTPAQLDAPDRKQLTRGDEP